MAMVRWKPARWTPARIGTPKFLEGLDPMELAISVGGGLLGGLMFAGKGVGDSLNVSPAAGSAIGAAVMIGFPLLFGEKYRSSDWAKMFYGIGVGLGAAAALQVLFTKPAPAPAAP